MPDDREEAGLLPWWVWSLGSGLPTGALAALLALQLGTRDAPVSAVVAGVVTAVVVGAAVGPLTVQRHRRTLAAVGASSDPATRRVQLRAARLGLTTGRVPADARTREVTGRLARHRAEEVRRAQVLSVVLLLALAALAALAAVSVSAWWWVGAGVLLAVAGWQLGRPARLLRLAARTDRLRSAPPPG